MRVIHVAAALMLALVCQVARAQTARAAPFAEFERSVQAETGGFAGNKERLSGFFNEERRRLGPRFEEELLKYLGSDTEKHYWISFFLESPSYLHGSEPLPHLSLLIKQQGIALLDGKKDEESRGRKLGLSVTAAVLAEQLGLHPLAVSYKERAERLFEEDKSLGAHFPAMFEEEHRLYRNIKSAVRGSAAADPTDASDESEPKARVNGGVLDGKAISKPAPGKFPGHLRVPAEVRVRVVVDEAGRVMWAKAVSGHPLLHAPAVAAARKALFAPTLLSGRPVKVAGVLTYIFEP